MAYSPNTASAWSIKYLHIPLLYFIYAYIFYSAEARPTGSKLLCEDGCRHIHLVLGVDNHLVPRWTFHQVCDIPENVFQVRAGNHLVPSANFGRQILGSDSEKYPVLCSGARSEVQRQVLVLDIRNHLAPIRSTIYRSVIAEKVLSPNIENKLVPFVRGPHDRARGAPLRYTVLDMDSHLVEQRTVFRRDGAGHKDKHQVFMLNTDSHITPLRDIIHRDEFYPQTPVSDSWNHMVVPKGLTRRAGADTFLVLNYFSHLVPVQKSGHCYNEAKEAHFTNTKSNLVSGRVIRRDETDRALFLDTDSHLVPLKNVVRGESSFFHIVNQPSPPQRMARRAESDDVSTPAVGLGVQQGNYGTTP